MEINRHTIVKGLASWVMAALVATVLVWGAITYKDANHEKQPCKERACFMLLEKRISAIEIQMIERTKDRYTSNDAKRDQLIMNARIDDLHKR